MNGQKIVRNVCVGGRQISVATLAHTRTHTKYNESALTTQFHFENGYSFVCLLYGDILCNLQRIFHLESIDKRSTFNAFLQYSVENQEQGKIIAS